MVEKNRIVQRNFIIGVADIRCPVPIKISEKNRGEILKTGSIPLSFAEAKKYLQAFYRECTEAVEEMDESSFSTMKPLDNQQLSEIDDDMPSLPEKDS